MGHSLLPALGKPEQEKLQLTIKLDTITPPAGLALLPIGGVDQTGLRIPDVSAGECVKLVANQRSPKKCATGKA